MKHDKTKVDGSPSPRPKLSSQPKPYVDVNDLRLMLKLGLGLHSMADPRVRLEKACDGLVRMIDSDAWVATTLTRAAGSPPTISVIFAGGRNAELASAGARAIELEGSRSDTAIGRLIASPTHTPGRVLAVISQTNRAIHTVLHPEKTGRGPSRLTWISAYRLGDAIPYVERERRMVELFHSQTAWLLLQMAQ
jgi:hypothetical protein